MRTNIVIDDDLMDEVELLHNDKDFDWMATQLPLQIYVD